MRAPDGMDGTVEVVTGLDGARRHSWRKVLALMGVLIAVGLTATAMAAPEPPALALSAAQAPAKTAGATKDAAVRPLAPSTSVAPAAQPGRERAFCEVAGRYLLRVRNLSISLSAKDRARDLLAGAPATAQLAAAAPVELRPDVVVLSEAVNTLSAKLEAAGYDLSRLAPDALMALQSPQVVRAMSAVEAWAQRSC